MDRTAAPTKTWHKSVYPSIDPTLPSLSLAGKSIVITGGGAGIGLAISNAVALAGTSRLAIIGRRAKVLADAKAEIYGLVGDRTEVFTFSADVANKKHIDEAFKQISSAFVGRPLDLLVNNAGCNIKGVYFVATAFIKNAKPDATIINVSSALAYSPATVVPGAASYAVTKIARSKIMEYTQIENPSLHVLNIKPGNVTETEMVAKLAKDIGELPHVDDAELTGHFVVWAARPEATFLKGKFVHANWDVDELKEIAKEIEDTSMFTLGLEGLSSFKYNHSRH